jgi:predicted histidine transporter YuiF (NhaC family)
MCACTLQNLQAVLWLMTGIAIALFIFYNVRRWFMDAQQLRQRQQQQQQREEEELELISTAEGGG